MMRKPIKFLWAGMGFTPNAKDVRVEMVIKISDAQACGVHKQSQIEKWIKDVIFQDQINLPANTYLARCNMERPSKGEFYGKIIVSGFVAFEDLHKMAPLYRLISLRTKIRRYVVEITGAKFTRPGGLR